MFQMKEQDKTPEEQLSEVEMGNLLVKEFRVMIVKTIQYLRKRMEAQTEKIQEMFNKELEDLKNRVNNTTTEMKTTLEGINSRINEAERISELEDRLMEITVGEENKEKRMKRNEDSLREFWDNIKCTNTCIIVVLEEQEREKGPEKIFEEIITKKFPNMGKETLTQVQETQSPI